MTLAPEKYDAIQDLIETAIRMTQIIANMRSEPTEMTPTEYGSSKCSAHLKTFNLAHGFCMLPDDMALDQKRTL